MRPRLALFDLNGTLLDPGEVGAPIGLTADESLEALSDAVLSSMAETLSGGYRPLPELLKASLARRADGTEGLEEAMVRAGRMPPFPDCEPALAALRERSIECGVLTNSGRDAALEALDAAGLGGSFALVVGSDEVEVFKPHPRLYRLALDREQVPAGDACMVAAHWWDLAGASRCGLRTAFVKRHGRSLLDLEPRPGLAAEGLLEVAAWLTGDQEVSSPTRAGG
jgi:2-haloacid dehalogenase